MPSLGEKAWTPYTTITANRALQGTFDTMAALCVATNVEELYSSVLIETPLAPYFQQCISAADLDELHIEIIRNTLYKAYLEDFYAFCLSEKARCNATRNQGKRVLEHWRDSMTGGLTISSRAVVLLLWWLRAAATCLLIRNGSAHHLALISLC